MPQPQGDGGRGGSSRRRESVRQQQGKGTLSETARAGIGPHPGAPAAAAAAAAAAAGAADAGRAARAAGGLHPRLPPLRVPRLRPPGPRGRAALGPRARARGESRGWGGGGAGAEGGRSGGMSESDSMRPHRVESTPRFAARCRRGCRGAPAGAAEDTPDTAAPLYTISPSHWS